ncbi:MAG: pirin family protein [Campylobacterales bacterium]|nr:pirin family protein [Campylobacterales bacterium]
MSLSLYKSHQRGRAEHGWLHARFSFSFSGYYDSTRMNFGVLRVLNNDIIEPASGFGMHPHDNMEIITYIIEGSLEHHDSEGNHGVIQAGEVQYMSAGAGVQHSERNPSLTHKTELFQIWIYPNERGGTPLYAQKDCNAINMNGTWKLLVSSDGSDDSIKIRQNASMYMTKLKAGESVSIDSVENTHGRFLMLVSGAGNVENFEMQERDELQINDTNSYIFEATQDTHLMLFEVPMQK